MAEKRVCVFLDFDGVLHGINEAPFQPRCLSLLENVLCEFEKCDVVVSSSWREMYSQNEIILMLGPIGKRVVGFTPVLQISHHPHVRFLEIQQYIEDSGTKLIWMAIDDESCLYSDDAPLLEVDGNKGITGECAIKLRLALKVLTFSLRK